MSDIARLFNSHKMKYANLTEYFKFTTDNRKTIYYIIDFDMIFSKYLYTIGYYDNRNIEVPDIVANTFIAEFLNLIAHYKQFFYNKLDSLSFFYIGIHAKKYRKNKSIKNLIDRIIKLITVIPRLYIYYYENDEYNFYLKYNLIRTIVISKQNSENTPIFIDMGKNMMSELIYTITKNYSVFRFDNYRIYLYGFNDFKADYLENIDELHINKIVALLPVYIVLNDLKITKKVRIEDVIMKFISKHEEFNYNRMETQLLVLKMFTKMKRLESNLKRLYNNLNSPIYSSTMKIITENWRRVIKDVSIYNINEMLELPKGMRINIETLMKY